MLPVTLIIGPTASGKSELAQMLAERCGGAVLNADSQQCYRGLDIGTGKVPTEQRRVMHALFDVCEPGEFMTAMDFARRADEKIGELADAGQPAILAGGTGLYLKALLEGLDELPARDTPLRERLQQEFKELGGPMLHARLQKIDPTSAAKIAPSDLSRLVRYLEIAELSGHAPSELFQARPKSLRYRSSIYWLQPPREALRQRIAQRVRGMMEAGWREEVETLLARNQDPRLWPNRPIGYTEIADFLRLGGEWEGCVQTIIQKTQQYAKRQETFFRGWLKEPIYREQGNKLRFFENFGEKVEI